MQTLVSSVRPSGHMLIARIPQGAAFIARFLDDSDERVREVTSMVAELVLTGALKALEEQSEGSGQEDTQERVDVAHVSYTEPCIPGDVRPQGSFTWVHLPTRTAGDIAAHDVMGLIAKGIAAEITEAVSRQAAEQNGTTHTHTHPAMDPEQRSVQGD